MDKWRLTVKMEFVHSVVVPSWHESIACVTPLVEVCWFLKYTPIFIALLSHLATTWLPLLYVYKTLLLSNRFCTFSLAFTKGDTRRAYFPTCIWCTLFQGAQTCTGAYLSCSSKATRGSKAAGASNWPLSYIVPRLRVSGTVLSFRKQGQIPFIVQFGIRICLPISNNVHHTLNDSEVSHNQFMVHTVGNI
jgi:hypothetical protein